LINNNALASRFRFGIQYVIELEGNNWEPRRKVEPPKVKDNELRDELEAAGLPSDHPFYTNNTGWKPTVVKEKKPKFSGDQEDTELNLLLEEYWMNPDAEEVAEALTEFSNPHKLVQYGIVTSLTKKELARQQFAKLIVHLGKKALLNTDQFIKGLEAVFSQLDDLQIDLPFAYNYVGDYMVALVANDCVPLPKLLPSIALVKDSDLIKKLETRMSSILPQ